MKRTIFGLGVLITITAFAGCGANMQEPTANIGEVTEEGAVTKQEINDVPVSYTHLTLPTKA